MAKPSDSLWTYLDANVLIGAWRAKDGPDWDKAWRLIFSEDRFFAAIPLLKLETIPHAQRNNFPDEVEFYEYFFSRVDYWVPLDEALEEAMRLRRIYSGISNMDVIHAASGIIAKVDQFITSEGPMKPLHRIPELKNVYLLDPSFQGVALLYCQQPTV
ncbi:hypothetical protein BH11ARM2_BH11ARM2_28140 [soil metagenome]